jgi:hypothetical protein
MTQIYVPVQVVCGKMNESEQEDTSTDESSAIEMD